jgi:hypothetical protein
MDEISAGVSPHPSTSLDINIFPLGTMKMKLFLVRTFYFLDPTSPTNRF